VSEVDTVMREPGDPGPEIVVVTGMSGAGRSTVGKVMEDQGWYVIDNLPISLLPDLLHISAEREGKLVGDSPVKRIGIVLNVHQLSRKVGPLFMTGSDERLRLAVLSFGFKYGVPLDADFVFDMRFLPNPFWVPELRPYTGRETQVADFVLSQPGAQEFIDGVDTLMDPVIAGYLRENRRYVTLAVGCTGGKHRSVAIAEAVAARLSSDEVTTFVVHRDLGQE
jgi:RNase adaptor protein for sRNA GlmZ degradation